MAIRIEDPQLDNTRALLNQVFSVVKQDQRAMFICPRGEGAAIVQRLRMGVSRARKKLERYRVRQQHFKLHHSIVPWTEVVDGFPGKRFDCVIIWRSRGIRHVMMEELEAML